MTIQEKTINKPVFIALAKAGDDHHWSPSDQCDRSAASHTLAIASFALHDSDFFQNHLSRFSPRSLQRLPARTAYVTPHYAVLHWRTDNQPQELDLTG